MSPSIPPPPPSGPLRPSVGQTGLPWWGPGRVAGGILAVVLIASIEAAVVAGFDPNLESLGAKLVLQTMLAATLIGVAFAVSGGRGDGPAPAGALGVRRPHGRYLKLAGAGYLSYIAFAIVYASLTSPEQEDVTRELGADESALAAAVAGLLIVVAAPISEEIFFRGFMFGGLRNRLPFWLAGGISAAIFGLIHYTGPDSLAVLPQLALFGLILAWLYERTGSILPTMAIHALNNAIAFAFLIA